MLTAPSYKELSSILMARRLYLPDDKVLQPHEEVRLNKRFTTGYWKFKDHPEIKQLFEQVTKYQRGLKTIGITDKEIRR